MILQVCGRAHEMTSLTSAWLLLLLLLQAFSVALSLRFPTQHTRVLCVMWRVGKETSRTSGATGPIPCQRSSWNWQCYIAWNTCRSHGENQVVASEWCKGPPQNSTQSYTLCPSPLVPGLWETIHCVNTCPQVSRTSSPRHEDVSFTALPQNKSKTAVEDGLASCDGNGKKSLCKGGHELFNDTQRKLRCMLSNKEDHSNWKKCKATHQ